MFYETIITATQSNSTKTEYMVRARRLTSKNYYSHSRKINKNLIQESLATWEEFQNIHLTSL